MKDRPSANLTARPVFAGPDAAIEVVGNAVEGFIKGEPSYPTGQLAKFIDRYRDGIVAAAETNRTEETQRIIFSGTWHHIDFHIPPRFEGCLTHVIARDGSLRTKLYDEQVFEWDSTPNRAGYGFTTSIYGELDAFADELDEMADHEVCQKRGRFKGECGLGVVGGMIWLADNDSKTPILYSAATCTSEVEFELDEDEEEYLTGQPIIGDGSLSAAIIAKFEDLKRNGGWFRGKDVDRTSHRPRKIKLCEAPDAIDAVGYWVQTRSPGETTSSKFRFFAGSSEWPQEVLEQIDDVEDDGLLGNAYVSDWIYEPAHDKPDQEIRLLALGPIPHLSLQPL